MNSLQRRKGRREFKKLKHSILIDSKKYRDAEDWCLTQFGKRWKAMDDTDGAWTMFGQDQTSITNTYFILLKNKIN